MFLFFIGKIVTKLNDDENIDKIAFFFHKTFICLVAGNNWQNFVCVNLKNDRKYTQHD